MNENNDPRNVVALVVLFVLLNAVPWLGRKAGLLAWQAAPFLFKVHVVMAFVLLGDVLFAVLFVLPLRFIF